MSVGNLTKDITAKINLEFFEELRTGPLNWGVSNPNEENV